jgi:hypothetical protein
MKKTNPIVKELTVELNEEDKDSKILYQALKIPF